MHAYVHARLSYSTTTKPLSFRSVFPAKSCELAALFASALNSALNCTTMVITPHSPSRTLLTSMIEDQTHMTSSSRLSYRSSACIKGAISSLRASLDSYCLNLVDPKVEHEKPHLKVRQSTFSTSQPHGQHLTLNAGFSSMLPSLKHPTVGLLNLLRTWPK